MLSIVQDLPPPASSNLHIIWCFFLRLTPRPIGFLCGKKHVFYLAIAEKPRSNGPPCKLCYLAFSQLLGFICNDITPAQFKKSGRFLSKNPGETKAFVICRLFLIQCTFRAYGTRLNNALNVHQITKILAKSRAQIYPGDLGKD